MIIMLFKFKRPTLKDIIDYVLMLIIFLIIGCLIIIGIWFLTPKQALIKEPSIPLKIENEINLNNFQNKSKSCGIQFNKQNYQKVIKQSKNIK